MWLWQFFCGHHEKYVCYFSVIYFLQTFDAKNNLMKKYYNENNVLFLSRWWLQFHLVWLWCKDLRYFLPSRFPVSFFLLFLRSSSRRRSSGTHVMKTLTIATAEPIQELVPVLPLRQNWFQWNQLQLTTLPFSTWVDWLMAGFPKLWAFSSFFLCIATKTTAVMIFVLLKTMR